MKQKQLSILAASLIAAFAGNVAFAGNISSSNPQIAREVITSDTQDVLAPEVTYAFQGDLNTASQIQTMQVQLILTGGGKWDAAAVTASSIQVYEADGITAINPVAAVTPSVSADGTTLFATLTFAQDAKVHKTPVVSFNRVGKQSNLVSLFSVVGTVVACDTSSKQLPVAVKHFTGVPPGSTTLAVAGINGAFEDESARAASNNKNVLMNFPTNINLNVVASTGAAKVDPANQKAFKAPAAADATTISTTLANLGSVSLKQQATGYDSNFANVYDVTSAATKALGGVATATVNNGVVEAKSLDVTVNATQGFVPGGKVFLSLAANCSAPIAGSSVTVTGTTGNSLVTSLTTANLGGLYNQAAQVAAAPFPAFAAQTVQVCYDVSGATTAIPPSSFTSSSAQLTKAAGTLPFPEQNNSCQGPLFALQSGVKIDVRNYATATTAGGWLSVIRLINPSETNTAAVYGQLIHADGSYGNWGPIATLAPRAVTNLSSDKINAMLVNVPTTVTPGAAQPVANPNQAGDRLRVTADGVGSLRVQNYLYNPASQNFIEASSTQAVDFDGTTDRAPLGEGQYQSQDAYTGLKK